jgi:hypothetical protein
MTAFEEDMNTTERALSGKSAPAASIFADGLGRKNAPRAFTAKFRSALGGDVEQVAS